MQPSQSTTPPPANPCAGRRVVVVLGMHNSGTSLVAHIVSKLGVVLGDKVLTRESFTVDRPYDYWEHAVITELQEEALRQLGRHWGSAQGADPIPPATWRGDAVLPLRRQLAEVVRQELSDTAGAWAFKDPRTARFLPLWQDILDELGIETVYVVCTRAAGTVTRSFTAKAQVQPDWAEALWRRTYLEILAGTAGRPRLFIDYDEWFERPAETVARLDAFLAAGGAREAALALIDPKVSEFRSQPHAASPAAAAVADLLRRAAAGEDVARDTAALLAREDRAAAPQPEAAPAAGGLAGKLRRLFGL